MYSRHIIINFSSLSYLGWGVLCCVVVYTYMYVPVCYYRLKLLRNDRLHHCWNPLGCWMIIMNFLSLYINMSVSFVNVFQCRIYDQSFSFIQFFSGSDLLMLAGVVRLHRLVGTISLCRILHTVKVQCKFHFQLQKKNVKRY